MGGHIRARLPDLEARWELDLVVFVATAAAMVFDTDDLIAQVVVRVMS